MSRILRSPRATLDVLDLWQFIADASGETRADAVVRQIEKKLQVLAQTPKIGTLRPELRTNLRSFPVGRYIVFYLPLPDGINVIRVLHGARDIDTSFFEEDESP